MSGTLHLVATPIGHLSDLGGRARAVLEAASAILCEDTRVTRKLLDAYGIDRPTLAFHAHSTPAEADRWVARLVAGDDLALVSDAGTPLLSDPGADLVEKAIAHGIRISPVPGPSALLAAIVASGLRPHPFVFLGFLPRSRADQREALAPVASLDLTLVVYEAPTRVGPTLAHLAEICGPERPACVARELTKRFETFDRAPLETLAERYAEGTRGEVVLVVGPPDRSRDAGAPARPEVVRAEARRLLAAGTRPSEAAKILAGAFGLTKKAAYQVVLDERGDV